MARQLLTELPHCLAVRRLPTGLGMLRSVMLCCLMLRYAVFCNVVLRDVMLGHGLSRLRRVLEGCVLRCVM